MASSVKRLGAVGAAAFRSLMAGFPTGVAVVTAVDRSGEPMGMTCSSLCSVTLQPPTLLVCLRIGSPTLEAAVGRRAFAVNLLRFDAWRTAQLFSSGAADRFEQTQWTMPGHAGGPHLTSDANAIADCLVSELSPSGTHIVMLGVVQNVYMPDQVAPLLYGYRRYAAWPQTE